MDDLNLPPRATEANIAEIQTRAKALGFIITTRCTWCGAPLFDPKSLTIGAGPVCRAKHEDGPGAHPAKNARPEAA